MENALPPPPHEEIPFSLPEGDQNESNGFIQPSPTSPIRILEQERDHELLTLLDVLKKMHREFYDAIDNGGKPDLKVYYCFINLNFVGNFTENETKSFTGRSYCFQWSYSFRSARTHVTILIFSCNYYTGAKYGCLLVVLVPSVTVPSLMKSLIWLLQR